ncbi:MAG: nucleotidyltransferase domain-containing protein [Nitrosopumilus sp.]
MVFRKNPDDLKRLYMLLDDLVERTTVQYKNQIVSVVLFGSATTSEWVRGKSDIDCIVLVKDKKYTRDVEQFLYDTLLELDKKYDLKLADTCTSYKKTHSHMLNMILRAEKFSMFGRPFYVLSEDQIDIASARITATDDLKIYVGTHVLASINLFFHRIKSTGKVLYGRDITKEFPTKISNLEKFKASLNALLLLMMSFAILPIDSRFAFQHAVKANFWACDNSLFALERSLSNTESEVREIENIFSNSESKHVLDVNHLHQSMEYKKQKEPANISKSFVLKYTLKTTRFVMTLYYMTLQKMLSS